MKRIVFAIIRFVLSVAALVFVNLPLKQVTVYLNDISGVRADQVSSSILTLLQESVLPMLNWVLPTALIISAILAFLSVFPLLGKLFNLISRIVFGVTALIFLVAMGLAGSMILHF